jgi:hypothetical protein
VTGVTDRDHIIRLACGRGLRKEAAMYGGFGLDVGKGRMNDRMREAEAYRQTKGLRDARAAERRVVWRRVGGTALALVLWPIRH